MDSPIYLTAGYAPSNPTSRSFSAPGIFLLPLAILGWCAFSPAALGLLPAPSPDGGYPGQNTAEGSNALTNVNNSPTSGDGQNNTALGSGALHNTTTGGFNTGVGSDAVSYNTTGDDNTAVGAGALRGVPGTGAASSNTAIGRAALFTNNGTQNTASGYLALTSNYTGDGNTADGSQALRNNNSGDNNTASGLQSLYSNTGGGYNAAHGYNALYTNTTGNWNTAIGALALFTNNGNYNTACGAEALQNNTTGADNVATGLSALFTNSSGYDNTANGFIALYNNTTGHDNTAVGYQALSSNNTGNNNVALGMSAGYNLTTGSNNIVIGAGVTGAAGDANKIRLGKSTHTATYVGGIYNKSVASGTASAVFVDSTGKLGTVKSSARYKEQIKPMEKASEGLLKLKPVTFRYKEEIDSDGILQFGLVAEQVEKIDPRLVIRDEDGKVITVRYEAVNAMLLNEFLKEHRKVQQLEANALEQQKEIEALTAGLDKVTARVEAANSVTRVVSDN